MARNILITGGNSGIGREMAAALAAGGDRVIIASRDAERSAAVADEIKARHTDARIEAMALDLGNFEAIDRFADNLHERMPVIDVLILNAGLYTHGTRALPNGLEMMIGVMHFGHFRLTQRLLDSVKAADDGRIVVTASVAHKLGRIRERSFTDPDAHRMALFGYAQAKLANILFTRELARRVKDSGVTVNCFHPGAVATGIWTELPALLQKAFSLVLVNTEQGADTGLWLATSQEAGKHTGEYFTNRKIASLSKAARDDDMAAWLWQDSEARMR